MRRWVNARLEWTVLELPSCGSVVALWPPNAPALTHRSDPDALNDASARSSKSPATLAPIEATWAHVTSKKSGLQAPDVDVLPKPLSSQVRLP
jgi:hypothetical protein